MIDPIFVSMCAVLLLIIADVGIKDFGIKPAYHKYALYGVVSLWAICLALIHFLTL